MEERAKLKNERKRKIPRVQDHRPSKKFKENAKKSKVFTEIEFKFMLRDVNTRFSGVDAFVEHARKWPRDSSYDLVSAYCRSSSDCHELLKLLESEPGSRRKPSEVHSVLSALGCILSHLASCQTSIRLLGPPLAQKLLSSHLSVISRQLSMRNKSSHIKAALKLLSAVAKQGTASCRQLLMTFDFQDDVFQPLLNRRDSKDPEDVRFCLVMLFTSLLTNASPAVISQLVQMKGLLNSVVQGMITDKAGTITHYIIALREQVLQCSAVSKTMKTRLFSDKTLKEMARLYQWKGQSRWKKSANTTTESTEELVNADAGDVQAVRSCIHQLLMDLCTSRKHGIIFHDVTVGTSSRNVNPLVLSLLQSLERPYSDEQVQQLVESSLSACPDLIRLYLPSLQHSMTPRNSTAWFSCVHMVTQILKTQLPTFSLCVSKKISAVDKIVGIATATLIPPSEILKHLLAALKHEELSVRHAGLQFLYVILFGVNNAISCCLQQAALQPILSEVDIQLRIQAKKTLPTTGVLMQCWGAAHKKTPENSDHKKANSVLHVEHLCLLVSVLTLHHKIQPPGSSVDADLLSLLEGHDIMKGTETDDIIEEQQLQLRLAVLELLAECSSPQLLLVQEKRSTVKLLISHCIGNPKAIQCVAKVIAKSVAFDGHREELIIWLSSLAASDSLSKVASHLVCEAYIELISDCIEEVLRLPHEFSERVQEVLRDTAAVKAVSDCSKTALHVQVQAVLESTEEDIFDLCIPSTSEESITNATFRTPFSGLILAVMDQLTSKTAENENMELSLGYVVSQLLRLQDDPFPLSFLLWQALETCPGVLPDSVTALIHVYLPLSITHEKQACDMVVEGNWEVHENLGDLLQYVFLSWKSKSFHGDLSTLLSEKINILSEDESLACTKQLLQYISVLSKQPHTMMSVLKKTTGLLVSVLKEVVMKRLENPENGPTHALLDVIFRHPGILDCFLDHTSPIQVILSEGIASIVKELPERQLSLMANFPNYARKLCKKLEGQSDSSFVLDIAEAFLPVLSQKELFFIVELLGSSAKVELVDDEGKDASLSKSGHVMFAALKNLTYHKTCLQLSIISPLCISRLLKAALTVKDGDLFDVIGELMAIVPLYCLQIEEVSLCGLLMSGLDGGMRIVCQSVYYSSAVKFWCSQWLINSTDVWSSKPLTYVTVINAVLGSANTGNLSKDLFEKVHETYWKPSFKKSSASDAKCSDSQQLQLFFGIIKHIDTVMLKGDFLELSAELSSGGTEARKTMILVFTQQFSRLMKLSPDEGASWIQSLILTLVAVLADNQCYNDSDRKADNAVIEELCKFLKVHAEKIGKDQELISMMKSKWTQLIKTILKNYFENVQAFDLLSNLLSVIYPNDADSESTEKQVSVAALYEMLISHSKFIPTMLTPDNDEHKKALLRLMCDCVERDHTVCDSRHVSVFLAAYSATLTLSDQLLLVMMSLYESSGCDFKNYRPFIWGQAAADQHSLLNSLGSSLSREPSADLLIDLIDGDKLSHSALNFPLRRKIQVTDGIYDASEYKSVDDCYDPAFLLPALAHIVGPEYIVPCRKFIEQGCLGYVLVALSSYDNQIRALAYYILTRFYDHLEGARFIEKEQYLCLLDYLRNAAPGQKNSKLASVLTYFLSSATSILLRPDCHMYKIVNQWLLSRPGMDVLAVPQFFTLFNSSSMEFEEERGWMLTGLASALRDTADYHLYQKRFAFKLLLSFFSSPLSNIHTKKQILEVVRRAVCVKKAALNLVKRHGILSWLLTILAKRETDSQLMSVCIRVMHSLWVSMLDGRDDRDPCVDEADDDDTVTEKFSGSLEHHLPKKRPACLPPSFTSQMLLACVTVVRNIRSFDSMNILSQFCLCIASILKHANKTNSTLGGVAQPLIAMAFTSEDLLLLLCHRAVLAEDWQEAKALSHLLDSQMILFAEGPEKKNSIYENVDNECKNNLLSIVSQLVVSDAMVVEVKQILGIIHWSLTVVEECFADTASRLTPLLEWVLCMLKQYSDIKDQFLASTDMSKQIRFLLDRIYEKVCLKASLMTVTPEDEIRGQTLYQMHSIFLLLLDFLVSVGAKETTDSSLYQCILKQKSFTKFIKKLAKSTQSRQCYSEVVSVMLREVWFCKDSPTHAATISGGQQ